MKTLNSGIAAISAILVLVFYGPVMAFHDGGVARCEGCHTMHNSADGTDVSFSGNVGSSLTKGSDPSSTCLNCHKGSGTYHMFSTDGSAFTNGGDFYWITKTFVWTSYSSTQSSYGDNHGHNVVAADFGLNADATLTQAPGGTFNAGSLGCTSCHDPHGNKNGTDAIEGSGSYGESGRNRGNFRLLGDVGYKASAGVTFTNPAPVARSTYAFETDKRHTDYGQNMSEWCRNCHGDFSGSLIHPAGNDEKMGSMNIADNYNAYVKTGDLSGNQATSYLALVPFERGVSDGALLDETSTAGPDASSNVMCLTCHRAHASAFPNAGRWDFDADYITESHPASTDGGVTGNDVLNSYYGRDMAVVFGQYQRSLCNKCHTHD